MLSVNHSFRVQACDRRGAPLGTLHITGVLAQRYRGPVGTNSSGVDRLRVRQGLRVRPAAQVPVAAEVPRPGRVAVGHRHLGREQGSDRLLARRSRRRREDGARCNMPSCPAPEKNEIVFRGAGRHPRRPAAGVGPLAGARRALRRPGPPLRLRAASSRRSSSTPRCSTASVRRPTSSRRRCTSSKTAGAAPRAAARGNRVRRARVRAAPAAGAVEVLVPRAELPRRAAAEGPVPPALAVRRRGRSGSTTPTSTSR